MLSRLMTRKEQLVLLAFAGAIVVGAGALTYTSMGGAEADHVPLQAGRLHHNPQPNPQPYPLDPPHNEPINPPAAPVAAPAEEVKTVEPVPPVPVPPAEPAEIVVSVMGEVGKPDVYTMADGSRVRDLLETAGGSTSRADLSDINLAARLIDGSTLTIPALRGPGVRSRPAFVVNPPQYTVSGWQPPSETPALVAASGAVAPGAEAPASPQDAAPGLIDLNSAGADELETLPGIGPKLASEIMAYRERTPFASVDDLANVSGIGEKKLEAVRHLVTVR